VIVVAGVALVAAAYLEAYQIAKPLDGVRADLSRARALLARGRVPGADVFGSATGLAATARRSVEDAPFPFHIVGSIPVLRRPVDDVKLAVSAADHLADAASVARDLTQSVLGPAAGSPSKPSYAPSPIFHDGVANLALIRTLPPKFQQMADDLQAARTAFIRIRPIPFVSKVSSTAQLGLAESNQALATVRDGLAASKLLPSFLGADRPKRYFFALQNNANQRATGGDVLAYALVVADQGRLTLEKSGPVSDLEIRYGHHIALPSAIQWYFDHVTVTHLLPKFEKLNVSPDFPAAASAWRTLLAHGKAPTVADGVIAIDPFAMQALFNRTTLTLPSNPGHPINRANVVQEVENGQYSLSYRQRKAFTSELIEKAWPALIQARPFVKVVKEMGQALGEKRIQMWSADAAQQTLIHQLGWDGSVKPGAGDYLFPVQDKLHANKLGYFARTIVSYDATLDASGTARGTATVEIDNNTPPDLPGSITGRLAKRSGVYALDQELVALYAPARAALDGTQHLGYPAHREGPATVFATNVDTAPHKPGVARFRYSVPGAVERTATGHVYRLTIQYQPMANPTTLHLRITLPPGAHVTSAPGWSVTGGVATFDGTLSKDMVLTIAF
jgi:Protein of unknown function (DUF4012)